MRARRVRPLRRRISDADLELIMEEAAPWVGDRGGLRRHMEEDEAFRGALLGHERVFDRLMNDRDLMVRVSPPVYFEVLLRRAHQELQGATHTMEHTGSQRIPVFDAHSVVDLLSKQDVLAYLADMLASFTRVESYVRAVRVKRGVWRKERFNDTDIDSLIRMCQHADDEQRLAYYKRIADVCLFILGVFPEYGPANHRYPGSERPRPFLGRVRRGVEEYEAEARRFYRLAGEHPEAQTLDLAEVFGLLHDNLHAAKKPLSFISEHYLSFRKRQLFGAEA